MHVPRWGIGFPQAFFPDPSHISDLQAKIHIRSGCSAAHAIQEGW